MAKELVFNLGGNDFSFGIRKLDRKKLYGWKETLAIDKDNNECIKATLDESGTIVIPKGGIALGSLDSEGNWVESSAALAVDEQGQPATIIPSSFDAPIELLKRVSLETYLNYFIDTVYILESEVDFSALLNEIKGSDEIYSFTFSYRTDHQANDAFLLENNGTLFILAGKKCEFEFLGLEEVGDLNEQEEDEELDDEFDFSMM